MGAIQSSVLAGFGAITAGLGTVKKIAATNNVAKQLNISTDEEASKRLEAEKRENEIQYKMEEAKGIPHLFDLNGEVKDEYVGNSLDTTRKSIEDYKNRNAVNKDIAGEVNKNAELIKASKAEQADAVQQRYGQLQMSAEDLLFPEGGSK